MPPPPPAVQLQGAAAAATWIFTPDPAIPNLAMPNLGLAFNIDFTPGGTAKAPAKLATAEGTRHGDKGSWPEPSVPWREAPCRPGQADNPTGPESCQPAQQLRP